MSSAEQRADEIRARVPGGRNVLFRLFVIDQLASDLFSRKLAGGPLTGNEFGVASEINALAPLTPKELAGFIGMAPTTLSTYLRRLEERGELVRRQNPNDGRSVLLELTAEGKAKVEATFPALRSTVETILENLDTPADDLELALDAYERALRSALVEETRTGRLRP
jgi:DNA-binding MarR family transcriptional regulator